MASEALAVPQPETLQKDSGEIVAQANRVTAITTAEDYAAAVNIGKSLRSMRKGIEEFFSPLKSAAHKAWKEVCNTENRILEPVTTAQRSLDGKLGRYLQQQEADRLERERVAREAAQKAEQDRLLAEAAHLSETGQQAEAEKVLDQAVAVEAPPVIMPSSVPKVAGASTRQNWKFEVTDLKALVEAVAAGKVPLNAIRPDDTFLGQMARAMKGSMKWPGVKVYNDPGVSIRS